MEKTTKKKKKKGMKKRVGLLVVGGLSLVLTICLSVGATLAWFAGSTWSSKSLFMGGPVYVEMAGRGEAGGTAEAGKAQWIGGAGNLDIKATAARKTGTVLDSATEGNPANGDGATASDMNKVLLPGQKYEIYSQARVFSTAYTTTDGTSSATSNSSGANVTNTEQSGTAHITSQGRTTTTTTSVLRARFSIGIEFDPYVGFNNFKDTSYAANYPEKGKAYNGDFVSAVTGTGTAGDPYVPTVSNSGAKAWTAALNATSFNDGNGEATNTTVGARRDAVNGTVAGKFTDDLTTEATLLEIKNGTKKSIYSWKFVSATTYKDATQTADFVTPNETTGATTVTTKYMKMEKPFDGTTKVNGVGYYGVWIMNMDDENHTIQESDSFYKERCNSYLQSYVEEYITEYNAMTNRTIGKSLKNFETELNDSFIDLINDSSDAIHKGYVNGMTVSGGIMTYAAAIADTDPVAEGYQGINASWLYVDPTIGNDTNTNELSTGAGGWWYLVETDGASAATNAEKITTVVDAIYADTETTFNSTTEITGDDRFDGANKINKPTETPAAWKRKAANNRTATANFYADTDKGAADPAILEAKLYEINPLTSLTGENFGVNGKNGADDVYVTKVVSYSFPFVNGTNVLPSKELTNVFANAKLTFQISFQAVQAFFPFTVSIDGLDYKDSLLGTEKALNIKNAIPIYNEAFEYSTK